MTKILYKVAPEGLLSSGRVLNTQTYNYGLVTEPAFAAFGELYGAIVNCSRATGLGFHHLTIIAMAFQERTDGALALAKVISTRKGTGAVMLNEYLPLVVFPSPVSLAHIYQVADVAFKCEAPIDPSHGFDNGLWEYLYEQIRETQAPHAPPRSSVVYASPDVENAERFMSSYPSYGDTIWTLDVSECESQFAADMTWLNKIQSSDNANNAAILVQSYWKQVASQDPIMEVLLEGEMMVGETLVR